MIATGWMVFYGSLAVIIAYALLDEYVLQPRRWQREFGGAWRAYNARAFQPQISEPGVNNMRTVVRVGEEMRSDGGKHAIRLEHGYGGIVVHEFSKAGLCSSNGPYYIRLRGCVWQTTGKRHIVQTVRYPYGLQTSNPSGGETREFGRKILEFDTQAYAPITMKAFAQRVARERLLARAEATPALS